ncbi:HAD-IIIC family phosphatase [Actinomadura graeca]|uniref:HAD-IIIC family phosphatase n=1 Tax=Actinomadura graeca TaxID=2750812 RepID=A0ABX8QZ02_9ACTN|nr:HAD-IIIC family phosphatase [Actinomadura graeca]QXJ23893.1 HAD-IIIC family phosphatase [Actinomadura graeca]
MGAVPTGIGQISAWLRSGRLAERYPEVPGLLTGLDAGELAHAGRLLSRLDPDEVARSHPGVPSVTVAITGHGTLAPLVPALTAELARHGLLLRPAAGDFDGYVFELSDPGSALYAADPDLALCVLDPAVVFDEVAAPWRPEDVERVLAGKLRLIEGLAGRFTGTARGTLVLNTLPLPSQFTAQLTDHRSRARLGAAWREAGAALLRLSEAHESLVTIDLDALVAEGIPVTDPRMDLYARMHLSAELLGRYAREIGHLARHLTGRTKKCLVVDLDGTLWGGVLGDDGPEGIEVGDGRRGEAFSAFQRTVKQIGSQGVLLAAVSKNDPEPVRQVLREHPGMVLREDDFVRVVANWRPKHDNLAELARGLNIGVDSLVFADDSDFERGLVRRELPGVAVIDLDGEPALHAGRLLADGWFDSRDLTAEDRARPARYREDLARRDFLDTFDSLEGYLAELDVRVRLEPVTEAQVPRVSQLTLRTNQFNLTTRRLQPADVRALAADPDASVLAVHSADRFGDNGLVGAVFLRRDGSVLRIDNFLLSCRVFSRGIEQACLAAVLRHAAATDATAVLAGYRPTAKNGKVRDFYPRQGFRRVGGDGVDDHDETGDGGNGDGGAAEFRHDLRSIAAAPAHLRLIDGLGGETR